MFMNVFVSMLHNIILTVLKYVDVMKQLKMKNVQMYCIAY
jgi:hypothetical protein